MGITELLRKYLRKGFEVVARNLKCLLCSIKVAICQLMMNIPMATPMIIALTIFTLPRYSGARKRKSAPNVLMKLPFIADPRINQNTNSTWNFRRCSITSCTGNE